MATSIGVELGATAIRAVKLEQVGTRIQLVSAVSVPWSGSDRELARAVGALRKQLAIKGPVTVGLPTGSVIVATVQPLVVNRARAALGVEFELQQHLPYDTAQAAWHYQWLSVNGGGAAAGRQARLAGRPEG